MGFLKLLALSNFFFSCFYSTAAASSCSYPQRVNDTSNQYPPFYLDVGSGNGALQIDHRTLQMRPDPSTPGAYIVVVDGQSPTIALALRNGTLYQQAHYTHGPYQLGLVGGLRNASTGNTNTQNIREFVFRNLTGASPSFLQTYNKWQLYGGLSATLYDLTTTALPSSSSGWYYCPIGSGTDMYYQIIYAYSVVAGDISLPSGCEYFLPETFLYTPVDEICSC